MTKIEAIKGGQGWNKLIVGILVGSLLGGGTAYSLSVNNTPEGGYLLCYNIKTGTVTYPGKLKCPTGTKSLEVAGVNLRSTIDFPDSAQSPSSQSSPLSSKCFLSYLRSPGVNIEESVATCSSQQLNSLIQELDKVSETSKSKEDMAILTAIVAALQKKVKG